MTTARRRLPLTALRTFEAAARLESFKEAASELGVSPTTVSNQIRGLEREWNCLLFVRKTRQVVLTETGQSLGRVVRQAFDSILRELDFHVATSRHAVAMVVGAIFGGRWLSPRLERFHRELPKIELTLLRGRRIVGASDMPAPIVVDWGSGDWPGLEVERLMEVRYAPVVSPALAERLGGLHTPKDLVRYPILHQSDRSEWKSWLRLAGHPELRFSQEMIVEDSNIALQAAIAGQGVVLGVLPFVAPDLEAGRLIQPFKEELVPERAYYLLTRPGARRRPEIAAICNWLRRESDADKEKSRAQRNGMGANRARPVSRRRLKT